ncbi:hypothetical protein, partial [Salmonella enterica]|uniref:hypothetical protein n=1 Tax=Salmonella enterica TaxID=28901 RepID=UPI001293AB81
TEPVRQKQQAHAFPAHRFKVTDRCTFAVAEIVPAPALSDAAPVVTRLNVIEAHREQERAAQHQKALELERSQRQRTYNGPSL